MSGDECSESTTLLGYTSPRGHDHDDNCVKRTYRCDEGHDVVVSKRNRCHRCDWVGKATCPCHTGDKVNEWP